MILNLWGVPKGNDDLLMPLGPTGKNPNSESPNLEVEFEKGSHPIVFPSTQEIRDFAEFMAKLDGESQKDGRNTSVATKEDHAMLKEINLTFRPGTKHFEGGPSIFCPFEVCQVP